tara:strand:- start:486 stop:689 length:204 start_codon:yes stop_codon:yes gene_type:complete
MDLSYFGKTDLQLQKLSNLLDYSGKEARREIRRRKLVGYSDGTTIIKIDDKAPIEEVVPVVEDTQTH